MHLYHIYCHFHSLEGRSSKVSFRFGQDFLDSVYHLFIIEDYNFSDVWLLSHWSSPHILYNSYCFIFIWNPRTEYWSNIFSRGYLTPMYLTLQATFIFLYNDLKKWPMTKQMKTEITYKIYKIQKFIHSTTILFQLENTDLNIFIPHSKSFLHNRGNLISWSDITSSDFVDTSRAENQSGDEVSSRNWSSWRKFKHVYENLHLSLD